MYFPCCWYACCYHYEKKKKADLWTRCFPEPRILGDGIFTWKYIYGNTYMEYYMECNLLMSQLFKNITKISFFDLIAFGLSLMRRFNRKTQHSDSPLKKFCSSLSALLLSVHFLHFQVILHLYSKMFQ